MNKRILSVFALSAAFLTVCAQQDKGGISPEMLNQIKQSYQGTTTDKAIRNAIGNNDIAGAESGQPEGDGYSLFHQS